jgi:DNA-binding LacI/PurR family transcriptional regulator
VFQEVFQPTSPSMALIHQDDLKAGQLVARHLLSRGVRSVVFLRPMLDWCAIEQREKGLRSVTTGFNGFDAWRYTQPALTTVISPAYEMGRVAGQLLMERLKGKTFSKSTSVFPVSLQVGQSS